MLRVSHLRKLVKPSAQCREILVDLLGTEVGAPVSAGLPADILAGTVVATGAGYDFTNAALRVTAAGSCPESSELTFSITGTGPVPPLAVYSTASYRQPALAGVIGELTCAAGDVYNWSLCYYLTISEGAPYELKYSITDNWVGMWLNGTRIGRATVYPGLMKHLYPWTVEVGRYGYWTYTGHVDSVRLAHGALPDIDVL